MIRPTAFWSNPETAVTNEFQRPDLPSREQQLETAREEFDGAVSTLRNAGINVVVVEDTAEPVTPDAVFPNNWLTTHANGACVMYPMQPASRRAERRPDIIEGLKQSWHVQHVVDWSGFESTGQFLEGTGSMVLDRINRIAYACHSARTCSAVLEQFGRRLNYRIESFAAAGPAGKPLYHTNVMMCIGSEFGLICADAIGDRERRQEVLDLLGANRELVFISMRQLAQFAGNMLEVQTAAGKKALVMSARAYESLDSGQIEVLERYVQIIVCDVTGIEDSAGGSIRCMIAEIFPQPLTNY